jgi:hypothetical protein
LKLREPKEPATAADPTGKWTPAILKIRHEAIATVIADFILKARRKTVCTGTSKRNRCGYRGGPMIHLGDAAEISKNYSLSRTAINRGPNPIKAKLIALQS